MHVHLPKPMHGWRAFVGEVGIIVLGVLIALGAEQLASDVSSKKEARNAREAIRGELELDLAKLRDRQRQKACVDARLSQLQTLLDGAESQGNFAAPSWVGRPQLWTMQTARWDATSQAGRAALLSQNELAVLGAMYALMRGLNGAMVEEQADWVRLRSLEHLHALSPQMHFDLTNTLGDARYLNWRINMWSQQLDANAATLNLRKVSNDVRGSLSVCVPFRMPRSDALRLSHSPYGEP